jgi:lipoic acid synthetase
VYNHNLEVVERLQLTVRPQADYGRSLGVLRTVKKINPDMVTKSGFMLGLGESLHEVREAARDLRDAGCDILTIGQYLPPTGRHQRPHAFIPPQVFDQLAEELRVLGFRRIFAGPHVWSSYHAEEILGGCSDQP